jgi:hypothetical protein
MDAQHLGGLISTAAIEQIDDNQVVGSQTRVATTPQMAEQPLLDTEPDLWDNRTHGNSLAGVGTPVNICGWEFPFSLVSMPSGKSKTLQLNHGRLFRERIMEMVELFTRFRSK